jgi:N-acetylneuraminic acid mutarotase
MSWPPAHNVALILSAFILASCDENRTPTEPAMSGDLTAAETSHPWLPNHWTAKPPLPGPTPWFGVAAGVRNDAGGRPIVYVFGGNFYEVRRFWIDAYNLATNTWTTKTASFEGTQTNGVGLIGGKLYISGGYFFGGCAFCSESRQKALYAYDPGADRITRKADMPRPTSDGVTGVINSKLYVLSGACTDDSPPVFDCDDPVVERLLYRYDPVTNTWITLRPAPHSHAHGAGGVIHGKFYVAGGSSSNILDVYDPWSNTWKTLAPLPAPRVSAAGAIQNGKLWVIGSNGSNRTTYAYDPVTNKWTARAPLPVGGATGAAVPLSDSQSHILVIGGGPYDPHPVPSELYTP